MYCPNCKGSVLSKTTMETDLPASSCGKCGGIWITRSHYDRWRQHHHTPNATVREITLEGNDIPKAKLCPGCGCLMFKFKIASDIGFLIESCTTCGGFWLDANEWDALKASGLHDNLTDIISAQWQKDIRTHKLQHAITESYKTRLGPDDFSRVHEFRSWLNKHPQKSLVLAYLGSDSEDRPWHNKT